VQQRLCLRPGIVLLLKDVNGTVKRVSSLLLIFKTGLQWAQHQLQIDFGGLCALSKWDHIEVIRGLSNFQSDMGIGQRSLIAGCTPGKVGSAASYPAGRS